MVRSGFDPKDLLLTFRAPSREALYGRVTIPDFQSPAVLVREII